MGDYHGKPLVVRRDRTVVWGGEEIGYVYPEPGDMRINHDWCYEHNSGTTADDVLGGSRHRAQGAFTKRGAAEMLVSLHRKILSTEEAR